MLSGVSLVTALADLHHQTRCVVVTSHVTYDTFTRDIITCYLITGEQLIHLKSINVY